MSTYKKYYYCKFLFYFISSLIVIMLSWVTFILYFCCTVLLHYCEPANILAVFPIPSISHQVVFRPLMHELAKRGHQVTVITTDSIFPKQKSPANLTEIDVHNVSYGIWKEYVMTADGDDESLGHQAVMFLKVMFKIFEEQFRSVDVQKFITDNNKKIDLLFLEHLARPALSYSYLYKVPVISINSFGATYDTFDTVDSVKHPLIFPIPPLQRFHNITTSERIFQWFVHYMTKNIYGEFEKKENEQLKRLFGPGIPDLRDLKENIQMTFLNTYRILDNNRPVPPNVRYIGGIHQNPLNDLPENLKLYLDQSINGVIYMSFGSMILPSLMSQEKIKLLTAVFSELPYNVLLKWDVELPGCPKNVKIGKWFPQTDLLRHKNIKLFITHGGFQSLCEAIDAGVPLVGIPMSGDQWFNMELCLKHKIGLKLDLKSLTRERLKSTIQTVIGNESYRKNIIKLRNLTKDEPESPLERAVWWTEYVLRHGGAPHLRSAAAHMNWSEYYELNIVLILLSILIIAILLTVYFIKLIVTNMPNRLKIKMI